MKRFAFPLETARSWRFRQLELEENRLQSLFAEREALLNSIRKLEEDLKDEEMLLTGALMEAGQLAALDRFRRFVTEQKARLTGAVRGCEQRIDAQRQRVTEARRHYELLDRLREKALSQWNAGNAREQEQLAGELYLARCVRER
jgi:hypothetical protein